MTAAAFPGARRRARLAMNRALGHGQRRTLSMALLSLIVSIEFFENIVFVFSAQHVMGGIEADPRGFALVQGAYAFGSMLMIVKQQWLARALGYRRYLLLALGLFLAGALMAAGSGGLGAMAVARFVQGFGGGALFTSTRVLVTLMVAPAHRPRALRYFMVGIFAASALAPAVAGELIEWGDWRDVFYLVVPFVLIALLGTWLWLPDAEPGARAERPVLGPLAGFGLGVAALQLACSEARYDVFSQPLRPVLLAAAGLLSLVLFLRHQWRHERPVIRLDALRDPVYRIGLVLYFMYYLISYLSAYLFPVFAERALGMPVAAVGWLNAAAGLVSLCGILVYVRVAARLPRKKPLMVLGLVLMAGAAWWFAALPDTATRAQLLPGLVLKGLFGVLVVIPVAGATFRGLASGLFAHGYQTKNLMRQLASSLAASMGAVMLANREAALHAELVGQLAHAQTQDWFARTQAALQGHGLDALRAAQWAQAWLEGTVSQQALLLASDDLYRMIAGLAVAGIVLVLCQRRVH